MKRGDILLEDYLNELYEGSDNQDENDSLEVSETELIQNECLYRPCYCGSYQHNEGNGSTHARRLVEFFGNSEEGADTEELVKYIVVNKYARHKYYKKRLDSIHILLGLLC